MASTLTAPPLSPFRLEGDYITQLLTNIRTRSISWTSFQKAGFITEENVTVLKAITSVNDQEDPASRVEVILKDLPLYSKTLFNSISQLLSPSTSKVVNYDLLKILLVIFYDGLTFIDNSTFENTMTYQIFKISKSQDDPFKTFSTILTASTSATDETNDSPYIVSILSAHILTFLTTSKPDSKAAKFIPSLLSYIQSNLMSTNSSHSQFLGVQLLKEILSIKSFRDIYTSSSSSSTYISSLVSAMLNKNIELQMKYLSIYCLWTLTFVPSVSKLLSTSPQYAEIIPAMFKFANDAVKEKVVRLSISILINFLNTSSHSSSDKNEIIKKFLLANGLTIVKNLIERKWSDDELKEDLNTLYDLLNDSIKSLTNFDEYQNEIQTKHLIWSPCHKNSEFWYDNIDKFKENNWKLLKSLITLLSDDTNNSADQLYLNQSIICYDLAMIIKVAPEVVKVINNLGTKTKIMTLMNSPNSNVKFEALRTTQLLVANSL